MSDLRDLAGDILKETATQDGVVDAMLATRDGLVALGGLKNGDVDTVAAMAAAALAAAESASLDVGSGAVTHLQAQCDGCRLLVAGVDDQYVLVIIAEQEADSEAILDAALERLQTTLTE